MQIERAYYRGHYGDYEMRRLIESVHIYRVVLKELFSYFQRTPNAPFFQSDAIRDFSLARLRALAAMDHD